MLKCAAGNLDCAPEIAHGFFGRKGGVSSGIYASLNCGPGSCDDRPLVIENRRRARAALNPHDCRLLTLHQVHGAETVIVDALWEIGQSPRADAMATNSATMALGILTADCAPVLLADAQAHVVGAAHAGWKGALAGVVESAIAAMERLGARRKRIAAAIGPCISQRAYEVGNELRDAVLADETAHASLFIPSDREAHWRFDLPAYVRAKLEISGVGNIWDSGVCTYGQEAAFFSFRRATHRGESDYGRQLSAIVLL
jgi:hypothetical protein